MPRTIQVFFDAVKNDDVCSLEGLIAGGFNVEVLAVAGLGAELVSPLMYASYHGSVNAIRCLLDHGALVDASSLKNLWTPLSLASMEGHAEAVRLLIKRGASVDQEIWNEETPLQLALDTRERMIDQRVSEPPDSDLAFALHLAAAFSGYKFSESSRVPTSLDGIELTIRLLIESGASTLLLFRRSRISESQRAYLSSLVTSPGMPVTLDLLQASIERRALPNDSTVIEPEIFQDWLMQTTLSGSLILDSKKINVWKGPEYAGILCSVLSVSPKFTRLTLNGCNIGDAGAVKLAELLAHDGYIKFLDLEYCNIGDAGLVSLSEALLENRTLVGLNLNYNQITGNQAVFKFAEALRQHPSLIHIVLSANLVEEEGYVEILDAIAMRGIRCGTLALDGGVRIGPVKSKTDPDKLKRGEGNPFSIRVYLWSPSKDSQYGHIALETFSNVGLSPEALVSSDDRPRVKKGVDAPGIYASFWPEGETGQTESWLPAGRARDAYLALRGHLELLFGVKGEFLSSFAVDRWRRRNRNDGIPDKIVTIAGLSVSAINKAFEQARRNPGVKWRYMGDAFHAEIAHNCASLCLYLICCGYNFQFIKPLLEKQNLTSLILMFPEQVFELVASINEQLFSDQPFSSEQSSDTQLSSYQSASRLFGSAFDDLNQYIPKPDGYRFSQSVRTDVDDEEPVTPHDRGCVLL